MSIVLVKLPNVQYDAAIDNQLVNTEEMKPLKLYNIPVSTTFAIFDEYVLIILAIIEFFIIIAL